MPDCLPTGPRLGRIRGDLDRAWLELTAMREALVAIERPLTYGEETIFFVAATTIAHTRHAIRDLDLALAVINATPTRPTDGR